MTQDAPGASSLLDGKVAPPPPTNSDRADDPARATAKMTIHFGQGVPVPEGMKEGAASTADALKARMDDAFRAQGVDEAVLAQRGQPVSEMEYRLAQHKKASLLEDEGWKKSYFSGNVEARRTMAVLSIILGSPIKRKE